MFDHFGILCIKGLRAFQKHFNLTTYRSSRPEVFCKKSVLRNFAKFKGKHLYQSLFFNKVVFNKDTLAQVFSCELYQISNNTLSYRKPPVAASKPNTSTKNHAEFMNKGIKYETNDFVLEDRLRTFKNTVVCCLLSSYVTWWSCNNFAAYQ